MSSQLPDELRAKLGEFVESRLGLHFPPERWIDLERGLGAAVPELGFTDVEECARSILSDGLSKAQLESLATHLTIGETYFFRDARAFEALETFVLPPLIRERATTSRCLRIWSAGCSSGEEPFSIAIVVKRLLLELRDWQVTILATDINTGFLEKAVAGIYTRWSFRALPPPIIAQFFQETAEGRFEIDPEVRKLVTFSCLNLAEDTYPSLTTNTNAMDIIFCRNALMYFSPAQAARVLEKLEQALVPGGFLFTGASEGFRELLHSLEVVNQPGTTIYRKPAMPGISSLRPSAVEQKGSFPSPVPDESSATAATAPLLADRAPGQGKRARELANEGRLVEALAACDQAIASEKLDAANHYLRGMILQEKGALDDAVIALRRALYLDREFVLGHFALGNLLMKQGRVDDAERAIASARNLLVKHDPTTVLPESDGLTAGRLLAIINSMQETHVS